MPQCLSPTFKNAWVVKKRLWDHDINRSVLWGTLCADFHLQSSRGLVSFANRCLSLFCWNSHPMGKLEQQRSPSWPWELPRGGGAVGSAKGRRKWLRLWRKERRSWAEKEGLGDEHQEGDVSVSSETNTIQLPLWASFFQLLQETRFNILPEDAIRKTSQWKQNENKLVAFLIRWKEFLGTGHWADLLQESRGIWHSACLTDSATGEVSYVGQVECHGQRSFYPASFLMFGQILRHWLLLHQLADSRGWA